jgi:hypothetical protein
MPTADERRDDARHNAARYIVDKSATERGGSVCRGFGDPAG